MLFWEHIQVVVLTEHQVRKLDLVGHESNKSLKWNYPVFAAVVGFADLMKVREN